MRINQNIAAFNAYRNLSNTQTRLAGSLEKLSSGFRINRAADDASGLVNSENLRSQVGGLKVAIRNAQDAISLVQTAEGAQTEVHAILQRMRDLAVQAGNTGTNDEVALAANQAEIDQLILELDRISENTQFGKLMVFEDFADEAAVFQVGANSGQTEELTIEAVTAEELGVDDIDVTDDAGAAIDAIDEAIQTVSENRAELGAFQNRMESLIRNLSVSVENLSAAESRIRDTDMALEMVDFTRNQILSQAGTAMLAQANLVPQSVLSLLS